jgi:type II secretory pathway pseudopilin PulG
MRTSTRCGRGLSLVSVIVALALLGLVAAVFSSAFDLALRSASVVGRTSQALSIAQHKIDQMRAVGYGRLTYTELVTAGIIDGTPATSPYNFVLADDLDTYLPAPVGTISITTPESDLACVTVHIAWSGSAHTTGDISLVALISKE